MVDKVWLELLKRILETGQEINPRGLATKELLHQTISVEMTKPVLTCQTRKLNYRFMVAEAYWILSGDNTVTGISPYNKRIADFSDDGITFAGAYGPKISNQLPYVVNKLLSDPCTRQAVLTIWQPNPQASKDIPCTVALAFSIRNQALQASVFMRSSDVWLGLPYDIFNFSMLSCYIAALYNQKADVKIGLGKLNLTAASSHLYQTVWEQAENVVAEPKVYEQCQIPDNLYLEGATHLFNHLQAIRDLPSNLGHRWWKPCGSR